MILVRVFRTLVAWVLCLVALLLPYRPRVWYNRALAWLVHAPFVLFGFLARRILVGLGYVPSEGR